MTENIVRNGVAHSVSTNERTKNAVNPRNSFVDNDKPALADACVEFDESQAQDRDKVAFEQRASAASQQAPAYPSITDHYDTRAGSEPKKHLQDNLQHLSLENPTDNDKFFESLQKVEDRISTLRQKHPKSNYQSMGDGEHYVDNILFREKKNITSRFQSVSETAERDAPRLPSQDTPSSTGAPDVMDVNLDMPVDDSQLLLNGDLGAFDEDELRARVRKMQVKLTRVNQTLKDMEKKLDEDKN
jgi:hypothetical protein